MKKGDGKTKKRGREERKRLQAWFERHGDIVLPSTEIDSKGEKVVSG